MFSRFHPQDDPFSSLDLPTAAHIFEDGILHFCLMKRKRTVVLVTHELHFLPFAHAVSIKHLRSGRLCQYHTACLLFGILIRGSAPEDFVIGKAVPMSKGKNVNVTRLENYRGVSVSSVFLAGLW